MLLGSEALVSDVLTTGTVKGEWGLACLLHVMWTDGREGFQNPASRKGFQALAFHLQEIKMDEQQRPAALLDMGDVVDLIQEQNAYIIEIRSKFPDAEIVAPYPRNHRDICARLLAE